MAPVMTNSIIRKDKKITDEKYWDMTSEEIQQELRLAYLNTFVKPTPNYCPECRHELNVTEDEDETFCNHCGLIVSMSIEYVGVEKIDLPYGRH